MPVENNFHHDDMSRKNPGERLTTTELTEGARPDSPAWMDTMADCGVTLSQAGVRAAIFLHGSLHGTDLFGTARLDEVGGLKRGYSRGVSGLDALLAAMREGENGIPPLPGGVTPPLSDDEGTHRLLDEQTGDAGNFTAGYVASFEQGVNRRLSRPITCARMLWSGEHHHLGRAIAAVRLLDRLRQLSERHRFTQGDRVLVMAHGHAGLLLALVSNLLCPSPITGRPKLLAIIREYAGHTGQRELAATLESMERLLPAGALGGAALDVVTLGTPVRYGWDPSGIGHLLHIVNHRNLRTDGKTWLAKMELPQITMEMPIAWGGDYVQALAVAGSDTVPATEAARAANKSVWELVEPYDGFERWLECARRAVRVPSEGRCLLVDYKDCTGSTNVRDHYYGHACYTRREAMLFTTTHVVRCLYQP